MLSCHPVTHLEGSMQEKLLHQEVSKHIILGETCGMSQAMDTTDTHVAFGGHDVNAYEHPWQVKRLLMIRIFPSASKWPEIPDPLQTSCQNFECCSLSSVMSPHQSDQQSERFQVFWISFWMYSLNVFIFVFFGLSCSTITPMKCLKGHKSLVLLFEGVLYMYLSL